MDAAGTPPPRAPGRPLDPEVDRAILAAAGEIFVRDGFQNMTLPGVAAAAGVAKTTVYRRYPSTVELVLATINHLNTDAPAPDTGSARDDLATVLDFARLRFDLSVTGTLLTEEREHPELLEAARRQMIVPAIDRFRQVLRAGIERGELRADLDRRCRGPRAARQLLHPVPGTRTAAPRLGRRGSSRRSGRRSPRRRAERERYFLTRNAPRMDGWMRQK